MKPYFDTIMIELTNCCNFNCPFCPSDSITRNKGYMSMELLDKLLKEISRENLSEYIQFGIMGEPFLAKDIFKMIELAKGYNLKLNLFTNGSLLSDEIIDKILDSGIATLFISFRFPEDTGFALGSDYNFKQYEERLKRLLSRASEHNNLGKICLKVFKQDLYSDITRTSNIAKKLKADKINQFLVDFFDFLPQKTSFAFRKLLVNEDMRVTENIYVRFETIAPWNTANLSTEKHFKKAVFGACDGLESHFGILWNGDVTTCCKDYDGKNILGNVERQSLVQILNGEKTKRIIRALKFCYLPTDYCRVCRGGNSYLQSFINQLGSIFAFKLPFFRKQFLKMGS